MLSADDLRYFLEVARRRRLVAAAQALDVDHTTVGRRITRLERGLGHRLFDRSTSGWSMTEAGQRLLPHAESVESALIAAREAQQPGADRFAGTVRIAAPDGFGAFALTPALASLRARHPELAVELVTVSQHVPLGTRDFDIVVTLEKPPPRFHSRKLTDYLLRLYASRKYLERRPPIRTREDLHDHTLIWYVDDLLDVAPLRFLGEILPGHQAQIQTNNITGHWQAVVAGVGVAPLPSYIARGDPRLVPVLPDDVVVRRSYWLAVPGDLARIARIRAVVALLDEIVHDRRDDLLGVP